MRKTMQEPRRGSQLGPWADHCKCLEEELYCWQAFVGCRSSSTTHFPLDMAATKLRSSTMSLHGVFHKSWVFDSTCLYEAKGKPIIQQKCLFGSYIANYADAEYLYQTPIINKPWIFSLMINSWPFVSLKCWDDDWLPDLFYLCISTRLIR